MRRLFALLALLIAASAHAQDAPAASPDTAFVSMITVLPGTPSYARFGHTALRVHRPALGQDLLYNYGTFRFDATFLPKFVYGALDYELSVVDFPLALRYYATVEERGVIEQRLRLTPAQQDSLAAFLDWNARPENAAYRYLFLDDNCTTRARDAVERVLGQRIGGMDGALERVYPTFRDLLRPYQTGAPLLLLGTNLGLGARVDDSASPRRAQFLPDALMRDLDAATVGGQPLVMRTDTLVNLPRPSETAFPWTYLAAFAVLAVAVVQTLRTRAAPVVTRFDRALVAAAGGAGLLLAFLVFVSLHDVTRPNWNLAWALPAHLVYAFAAGPGYRWLRPYAFAAGIVAAGFVLASAFLPQTIPGDILPVVTALALRLLAHAGALPGVRSAAA